MPSQRLAWPLLAFSPSRQDRDPCLTLRAVCAVLVRLRLCPKCVAAPAGWPGCSRGWCVGGTWVVCEWCRLAAGFTVAGVDRSPCASPMLPPGGGGCSLRRPGLRSGWLVCPAGAGFVSWRRGGGPGSPSGCGGRTVTPWIWSLAGSGWSRSRLPGFQRFRGMDGFCGDPTPHPEKEGAKIFPP